MSFFFKYIYIRVVVYFIRLLQRFEKKTPPKPDAVLQIQSRDRNRTIKAHVYRPENPTNPSPVLLNFHGSGFILHLHGEDDYYARFISQRTQYTVFDIQYRLGPENPFPAALHDIEDVVNFVQTRPELYDSSKLSIGGFSAGANLSLSASSMMLPKDTFRSVLAFYPPTNLATQPDTKTAPDTTGKVIPPWIATVFDGSYFQDKDPRDPRISPFYAPAESFPNNVLIVTPAQDYLANEAQELAEKIRKDGGGKHVVSRMIEGQGHAWDKHCENGSEGAKLRDESYELAVEMLGR